jgi:hypothetical protein
VIGDEVTALLTIADNSFQIKLKNNLKKRVQFNAKIDLIRRLRNTSCTVRANICGLSTTKNLTFVFQRWQLRFQHDVKQQALLNVYV